MRWDGILGLVIYLKYEIFLQVMGGKTLRHRSQPQISTRSPASFPPFPCTYHVGVTLSLPIYSYFCAEDHTRIP